MYVCIYIYDIYIYIYIYTYIHLIGGRLAGRGVRIVRGPPAWLAGVHVGAREEIPLL